MTQKWTGAARREWRLTSPMGRGRIVLTIRVRGYGLTIDLNASPQPSPKGRGSRLPMLQCRDSFASPFDERLLDHKMAGLAVIALGESARFKHLAQLFQHGRAAAHHDSVVPDIERRLADVVKQLL
jgi:hypothetical protein